MGGDITVEIQLGKGSIFTFNIAVEIVDSPYVKILPSFSHVIGLKLGKPHYKILIVDDQTQNRLLLIKLLQPLGFELQEANNGREAIEKWQKWQPNLIFMDMRMPVMDGYEATQYIKGIVKGNATAIIAVTASVLEEEKAAILTAGCDDFIRKPFKKSEIFEAIEKHLGVEYLYQEQQNQDQTRPEILKPEDLMVMPQEWLDKLYYASQALDDYLILELVKEIPEKYSLLAD